MPSMYLFGRVVPECLQSILTSLRFLRRMSPSFSPSSSCLVEQAATPVCAVQVFIGCFAILVFDGACVCVVLDCCF